MYLTRWQTFLKNVPSEVYVCNLILLCNVTHSRDRREGQRKTAYCSICGSGVTLIRMAPCPIAPNPDDS